MTPANRHISLSATLWHQSKFIWGANDGEAEKAWRREAGTPRGSEEYMYLTMLPFNGK